MRIALFSDLHLEFSDFDILDSVKEAGGADVVVLAGDCGVGASAINNIVPLLSAGMKVVYVMGNHEGYHNLWEKVAQTYKNFELEHTNFHFLDRGGFVTIGDILFTGGTMWTDLSDIADYNVANYFMNDYRYIDSIAGANTHNCASLAKAVKIEDLIKRADSVSVNNRLSWLTETNSNVEPELFMGEMVKAPAMTPATTTAIFRQTVKRMTANIEMGRASGYKVICVTHHVPHKDLTSTKHGGSNLNPAYVAPVDHLLKLVDYWFCGHTHVRMDKVIDGCRVVLNCRGYTRGGESELKGEYSAKIIEV